MDELLRYLRSLGYRAEEAGYAVVVVEAASGDMEELRLRLDLQLRIWESVRAPEDSAEVRVINGR